MQIKLKEWLGNILKLENKFYTLFKSTGNQLFCFKDLENYCYHCRNMLEKI